MVKVLQTVLDIVQRKNNSIVLCFSEPVVCPVKRKSVSDTTAKAEGATPEKKAKLDESPAAEAEAKGEAEVAA